MGNERTAWPGRVRHSEEQPFLGREMCRSTATSASSTAQIIDEEVAKILHAAADRGQSILQEHRDKLESLAEGLLDREVLDTDEIEELIGPPIRSLEQATGGLTNAAAARQNRVRPKEDDNH